MDIQMQKLLQGRVTVFYERIGRTIVRDFVRFDAAYHVSHEQVPFEHRTDKPLTKVTEGTAWGDPWDSAWFHLKGKVPPQWRGRYVVAQLDVGGEGLVFRPDGEILQGITNGSVFDRNSARDIVLLFEKAKGGEDVELWVEGAANHLFGLTQDPDPGDEDPGRYGTHQPVVRALRLCAMDYDLWQLRLDVAVLGDLMRSLPSDSVRAARILVCLNQALDAYGDDPANATRAREILQTELKKPAVPSSLQAVAVGHAHIDTAWLWPISETIRKVARTYSSQIRLLERYPEYVFGGSQPQLYAYAKQYYPSLYEKVRRLVKQGRWECQGGMWVEADCNLISGESMVRQFIHGKNFFHDEFGVDVRNLWIPDVFGYSAALPQIMKKAGVDYFVTQKISWNQFNKFPHHTFLWRGIDGTEIPTHFPPEDTYNSTLNPGNMVKGETNFFEKGYVNEFLSLFGVGDGGGGPHEEHIEFGLRQKDLEGVPRVKFGHAQKFLEMLDQYRDRLPTWSGELYLELHRGTLTTQSRIKKGNRTLEGKLRQAEFVWSCLPLSEYPLPRLDTLWKTLLLHQFHDIIPGSSITLVYERTELEHAESITVAETLMREAGQKLFQQAEDSAVLVNCLSYPYARPVRLPAGWSGATTPDGRRIECQSEPDGAVALVEVPATGALQLNRSDTAAKSPDSKPAGGPVVLENDLIRYEIAGDGRIVRIYDREVGREVLSTGEFGNELRLYVDRPNNWDAWDVDIHYESQTVAVASAKKVEWIASGSVRSGVRVTYHLGNSVIVQNVFLARNSKRLDFETTVDWKERHRMLRVSFPVAVRSESATFDIQYGYVQRPTHRNTSWDVAKFEVAAHRYADLSSLDYGVALLNNCKYGHKIHDGVIDLNLLRSPTYPDPDADQGVHELTYSLLPHNGTLIESTVMAEAAALNVHPIVYDRTAIPQSRKTFSPVSLQGDSVSLEVVKKAEKEDCLVIRLVETHGKASKCVLHFAPGAGSNLVETNLMEWTNGSAVPISGPVELSLSPFEIRTYKVM